MSEIKRVWIVGWSMTPFVNHPKDFVWDFLGVYSDYDLALKKCVTKQHFLFPAPLNHAMDEILPVEIKRELDLPMRSSNDQS